MNISGTTVLVTVFLNSVLVFGQFADSVNDYDSFRKNLLKYLLYDSHRLHDKAQVGKQDSSAFSEMSDFPRPVLSQTMKRSHLFGLNRPITLRQTRLASFGTILRPNNDRNTGNKNILRYG